MKLLDILAALEANADADKRLLSQLRESYAPVIALADLPPMPENFKGVDVNAAMALPPLLFLQLIETQDDHNKLLFLTRYVTTQITERATT